MGGYVKHFFLAHCLTFDHNNHDPFCVCFVRRYTEPTLSLECRYWAACLAQLTCGKMSSTHRSKSNLRFLSCTRADEVLLCKGWRWISEAQSHVGQLWVLLACRLWNISYPTMGCIRDAQNCGTSGIRSKYCLGSYSTSFEEEYFPSFLPSLFPAFSPTVAGCSAKNLRQVFAPV